MDLFKETYHVVLELSNMCNYSYMHKKCPASVRKTKKILPARVVYNVLDTLGEYGYGKGQSIAFYLYSEALNDPRLFKFVEYAFSKCPDANIIVGTNGWYLTDVMAKELYEIGVTYLLVTSYTASEDKRLKQVRKDVAYLWKRFPRASFTVRRRCVLDNRMSMKGREEGACYSPLTELLIAPDAKLRFCCYDIDQKYSKKFGGNLLLDSFLTTVLSRYDLLKNIRDELITGKRTLKFCKECDKIDCWKSMCISKKDKRLEVDLLKKFIRTLEK